MFSTGLGSDAEMRRIELGEARIQLKIGTMEFIGEGEETWVSAQLDKILEHAPRFLDLIPSAAQGDAARETEPTDQSIAAIEAKSTLPSFLKKYNATKNQNSRFLATAAWLQLRGKARLQTGDVTRALSESNQARLGNPSDCLSQNVGKGFCERDGNKQFFVTDEGMRHLDLTLE